jgi:hypothetical protein
MKRYIIPILVILVVVAFYAGHIPLGESTVFYADVNEKAEYWTPKLGSNNPNAEYFDNYAIMSNTLYLLTQKIGHGFIANTINRPMWSPNKIKRFRDDNPHLEEYWPDSNQLNGGVQWIQ